MPTKKRRLNLTITNENVDTLEQLRSLMEKRMSDRFSLAEIASQLINEALAREIELHNQSKN